MIDISYIIKNKTLEADKLTAYGFHPTKAGYPCQQTNIVIKSEQSNQENACTA